VRVTQPQWIGVDVFIDHEGRELFDNTIPPVVGALTYPIGTGVRLCWAQYCHVRLFPGPEELQYVVRCAYDQPLCPHLGFASKQKLAYALHCLYLAEDRFNDLFSQGVGFASAYRP